MRWLCVWLPRLPIELAERGNPLGLPLVVYQMQRQRPVIWQVNDSAQQHAIAPGMTIGSAQALSDGLMTIERNPVQEQQVLIQVSVVLTQFSSKVEMTRGGAFLLEIERSLQLFGGVSALISRVLDAMLPYGYTIRWQVGWGATAALVMSALKPVSDFSEQALLGVLRRASLRCLRRDVRCESDWLHHLHQSGLRTFDDVLQMPRAALAKRLGKGFIDYWQRLWNEKPDLHTPIVIPDVFSQSVDLLREVHELDALLFPAKRLLNDLELYLRARQLSVSTIEWHLSLCRSEPLIISLSIAKPCWLASGWLELLRLRFEREKLAEPVREISLQAKQFIAMDSGSTDLFACNTEDEDNEQRLLSLLKAKLGDSSVQYLSVANDDWPEYASEHNVAMAKATATVTVDALSERPLFLLEKPERLTLRNGAPFYRGLLQFEPSVERFSSRWWQGLSEQREYRIACNAHGERFWLFRCAEEPQQWYLHGLFGF